MSVDLSHHGDADIVPGLVDLAVNVRSGGTPGWLAEHVRGVDLAAYPDQREAVAAVAARHGRTHGEVLLTAGAAEAFVLLARILRPRHAVVVHPQFTEPEAALLAAGHEVDRVILPFPFALDSGLVPEDADLVFVGNPTNPTSVAHPRDVVLALRRPGRIVVVDEAFADCLPGERESLAGCDDLRGVVVIRSLTKTWGLAGLRVGYLLAAPDTVRLLAAAQPLWAVSTPALAACVATASPAALREAGEWAAALAAERTHLLRGLEGVTRAAFPGPAGGGIRVVPHPAASFVLLETPVADLRARLLDQGFAVRRGETFPGLGPTWIRVAVRDAATSDRFAAALTAALASGLAGGPTKAGDRLDDRVRGAREVHAGVAVARRAKRGTMGKGYLGVLKRELRRVVSPAQRGHVEPGQVARVRAAQPHGGEAGRQVLVQDGDVMLDRGDGPAKPLAAAGEARLVAIRPNRPARNVTSSGSEPISFVMRSDSATKNAVFHPARLNALLPDSAALPWSLAASETVRYGVKGCCGGAVTRADPPRRLPSPVATRRDALA